MRHECCTHFIRTLEIKSIFVDDRCHITALSLSVDRDLVTIGEQASRLLPKFLLG
jgi:hypothetical protein